MAGKILDGVDEFLKHSASGSGGEFLKNWKKDEKIDVILHPKAGVGVLWSHRWFRIGKDKEEKTAVWSMRFNSMEKEAILRRQHFRDKRTGEREFPPEICPFSKTLEWVREAIDTDKISWTDEIFRFESQKEDVSILAGGFTGLFQMKDEDLTDDQIDELKKAKVRRDEAYKQNSNAQVNYVFSVLQYDFPEEGWLIAMEGKALGQAMQNAMADEQKKWKGSKTPEKGDYKKNPFVFRWEYDDRKSFDKKYSVVTMPVESLPLTAEHDEALKEPPPSLTNLLEDSNVILLKLSFEKHWVHDVVPPWDDIFADAIAATKGKPAGQLPEDFDPDNLPGDKKSKSTRAEVSSKKEAPPPPPKKEEEEVVACDDCGTPMKLTEFTCKKCGAEYDPETGLKKEKPKEPEAPKRSRSEAAKSKASA